MDEIFNSNLKSYLVTELEKLSLEYCDSLTIRDNFMLFINRIRRVPVASKRRIVKSTKFKCPTEYVADFCDFINLSKRGDSLLPFCSRKNFRNVHRAKDPLFDDWGITHFHFNKNGTKDVMFAMVEPDIIYLLAVYAHGSGHGDVWFKKNLIEVIHTEFPFLIFDKKLSETKEPPSTETEHKHARKYALNLPVILSDGASYFPTGTGVMVDKESIHDYMAWQHLTRQIDAYIECTSKSYSKIAQTHSVKTDQLTFSLEFSYDQFTQLINAQCKSNYGDVILL